MTLSSRFWGSILLTASNKYVRGWERRGKQPNGQTVIVENENVEVRINRRLERRSF